MSRFSGKCDLYDYIMMASEDMNEMECFNKFKKETGGVIYQHFKLELNEYNIDNEIKLVNNPFVLSKREVPWDDDKIHKTKKFVYTYWGKDYFSLKELNKKHYYALKEIRFETLLDIIPYYPYIVSVSNSKDGNTYMVISSSSFVDSSYETNREYGWVSELHEIYKRDLQNHYIDIVLAYFNRG